MTIVIGIGNLDRGDDAAGLAVARLLREKLAAARAGQNGRAPRVTVRELDGDAGGRGVLGRQRTARQRAHARLRRLPR